MIEIPGGAEQSGSEQGGRYRLDYRPPEGSPAPNFTVPARAATINFQGLPGTEYRFLLYYSNETLSELLTWNQSIVTAPEPPADLNVVPGKGKTAAVTWRAPARGGYSGFRLRVAALGERTDTGEHAPRTLTLDAAARSHVLRDLVPGASYTLHAATLLRDKESAAYASRNFTTKPNTPGKFIVWFRNETTLLVLWQPPYPPGSYTHYRVSIQPPDARDSELYVGKEGEPPGPAQAAFKGLVPGRAYNISVQTVSEGEISVPTTAQYRTVPLRPLNVTVDATSVTETGFTVTWLPPRDESEFEKYQVSVNGARRLPPGLRARDEPASWRFEGLEPGGLYGVVVKTMSGKVTSWPAQTEVALRPLPVRELRTGLAGVDLELEWRPGEGSAQDQYRVSYHEAGPGRDDSNSLLTADTRLRLDTLLPGRNYSLSVQALSHGAAGNETLDWAATRPLAPVVEELAPEPRALRLSWRSDVNSQQDRYELEYRRVDVPGPQRELTTRDSRAALEPLFPGGVYEVRLTAVSHGLRSEPHSLLQPVPPLPPRDLTLAAHTSTGVLVRWLGPDPDMSTVGEYVLRYRTRDEPRWTRLPPLSPNATEAEIADMTRGERYTVQLESGSARTAAGTSLESGRPLSGSHTVRPGPVSDVAALADARNVTLEWPRPEGRVDRYEVRWWPAEPEEPAGPARSRNVSGTATRALLDELRPGSLYAVTVSTHSYNLTSDLFTMEARTRPLIQSEMSIVSEAGGDQDRRALMVNQFIVYLYNISR